jgi:hypothetical protein
MNIKSLAYTTVFTLATAASANAGVKFSEIFVNPPGSDNGYEFIELVTDIPNMNMDGYTIVIIEAEGAVASGTIDVALSLNGKKTGSNRLFLWRDATQVLIPAPDPNTEIFVQDFNPDLENGAQVYLIVKGFTGFIGQDLDADGNGILDPLEGVGEFPWTEIVDVIGVAEEGDVNLGNDKIYAEQLGGFTIIGTNGDPTDGYTPDVVFRLKNMEYAACDVLYVDENSPLGPFTYDPLEKTDNVPDDWILTPGSADYDDAEPVKVLPDTYTIIRGIYENGSVSDLHMSDDSKLVIKRERTSSLGALQIMIDVMGESSIINPSELKFVYEGSSSLANATLTLRLFNYSTNTYNTLEVRAIGISDETVEITVTNNASNYVNPTTGEVKARILFEKSGFVPAAWNARHDLVNWIIKQ